MGAPGFIRREEPITRTMQSGSSIFSKAAAHLALHLDWKPEVLHVHDWQASHAGVAASASAEAGGAGDHAGDLPDYS